MRRMLVPVDFSPQSGAALRYAVALARLTGAEVEVLHVVAPPSRAKLRVEAYVGLPLTRTPPEVYAQAEAQLRALISSVGTDGCEVHTRVVAGDPAASAVQVATDERHDLVVLGTHGSTGITGALLGSVARGVISCAPCPVLTFRP
ncbi:MAG TPA: universal stress protein [Kofleriaceae bacterium]|nr:universal stress protein [Kofleriaceae bacterium]